MLIQIYNRLYKGDYDEDDNDIYNEVIKAIVCK